MQQNNTNYGGVGFLGLLTLLFIALKLTGVITWSWWWVLSPLLFGFAFWIIALLVILVAIFGGKVRKRW